MAANPREYKVIVAATLEELVAQINGLIGAGWQLQGGVAIYLNDKEIRFLQAIAR